MEEDIVITVKHPEQRSEIAGVNKFFVYTLEGKDNSGQIQSTRRYSDFNLLREVLLKRWPGCYIPSLPEKKTIGSGEHLFVESRRRGLIELIGLVKRSICSSTKSTTGDLQKQLSPFLKETTEKLFQRYSSTFEEFNKKDADNTIPTKISEFSSYIKDSKVFLEQLSGTTDKMEAVFKNNMQKKLAVLEFMLPDYERHCLLYNDEKKMPETLLFINEDFDMQEVIGKFKKVNEYPSVMLITEEIKRERRELEAIEENIKVMHEFEAHRLKCINKVKDCELKASKITAGKESLFSKITKQSKESQMAENQQELDKAQEEEKMYNALTKIISNLIALRQIDMFKQLRQKAYYRMLKNFAQSQKELAQAEKQIWIRVAEHENIRDGDRQVKTLGLGTEKKELRRQKQAEAEPVKQKEQTELVEEQRIAEDKRHLQQQ